ncbi:MAG: type II toxin-antitoxin system VapC family toxin [Leptolyngbyaceae cyanobacterium SM2_5_2]|nr:type II toxin-antitoxin system VapC family toxin [Leptolyngbyaceae cyanobacterium SM2_5_2]
MLCLVDTNILLRLSDKQHPLYVIVNNAVKQLQRENYTLCITAQNCAEFWNVATRPAKQNGFGLSISEAELALSTIEKVFGILPDLPQSYTEWRRLVVQFKVIGVQVHDARIVAAMRCHSVTHILTMNSEDFSRYELEGVIPINPLNLE